MTHGFAPGGLRTGLHQTARIISTICTPCPHTTPTPHPLPPPPGHPQGEKLPETLKVPRLRLRKKWFVGINPDPVDHSHPDVGGAGLEFEKVVREGRARGKVRGPWGSVGVGWGGVGGWLGG